MINYTNVIHDRTKADNIYPEGSYVIAHEHPQTKLIIEKYIQRIYYCSVVGGAPDQKQLAYFEKEVTPYLGQPTASGV